MLFMGTPEFAVPTLQALASSNQYYIPAVVTQPDKPAGRGQKLKPPPVKICAEQLGLPVFQPKFLKQFDSALEFVSNGVESHTIKDPQLWKLAEKVNEVPQIDGIIVAAYGKIIPSAILELPKNRYVINIHPSLLPRWRGAAPLQYTIFSGDIETGVSLMQLDEGLDTGPVYRVEKVPLAEGETSGSLHDKLSTFSADLLLGNLSDILSDKLLPIPQKAEGMTYAEKWEKSDCLINWEESAEVCDRRIRASTPSPGARTFLGEKMLKIHLGKIVDFVCARPSSPGSIVNVSAEGIIVQCGGNSHLRIEELQLAGKRRVFAGEFIKGYQLTTGMVFGS